MYSRLLERNSRTDSLASLKYAITKRYEIEICCFSFALALVLINTDLLRNENFFTVLLSFKIYSIDRSLFNKMAIKNCSNRWILYRRSSVVFCISFDRSEKYTICEINRENRFSRVRLLTRTLNRTTIVSQRGK